MKFRSPDKERKKVRASVDLTPLIDVVFQLLIFFMLSATFVVQSSIQIEMPQAEGTSTYEQKDLSVTLTYGEGGPDNGGRIFVEDDEMANWDELAQRLSSEIEWRGQEDMRLLIRADGRIPVARNVRVMGIARSLGISRFGLGAQQISEQD